MSALPDDESNPSVAAPIGDAPNEQVPAGYAIRLHQVHYVLLTEGARTARGFLITLIGAPAGK